MIILLKWTEMDSKGTEWSQIWAQFFDIKSPKSNITLLTIFKKSKNEN